MVKYKTDPDGLRHRDCSTTFFTAPAACKKRVSRKKPPSVFDGGFEIIIECVFITSFHPCRPCRPFPEHHQAYQVHLPSHQPEHILL